MVLDRAGSVAALLVLLLLLSACNGGLRPTLLVDETPTPQPALELQLTPAPTEALPLPPASAGLPVAATVDDALTSWAIDRAVPYLDSCSRVVPDPGELCDVTTERDTVRLLGPGPDQIWYVVTVERTESFESGAGYRVTSVELAGR